MEKNTKYVSDLMSREPATLQRNERLTIAEQAMKDRAIRHLPVLSESGAVCGMLSQRDLFRGALLKSLGYGNYLEDKKMDSLLVKEAMVSNVITTTPDTPIQQAAQIMIEHKIGCLPVLEDDELVGMLTEEDFVQWGARKLA